MNGILDTLTFFVFFLTILVLIGRGVWQIKKVNWYNSFFILIYLGLAAFLVGLVGEIFSYQIGINYIFLMRTSLGMVVFSFLAVGAVSTIEKLTLKKMKTLLRLPLIGFLLGWYLKPFDLGIAIFVIEMTQFALFFKFKKTHLYCLRQQAKSLLGMFLAFVLYYGEYSPFYIGLTLYFVMKFQIGNGVKLKLIVNEYAAEDV